MALRSDDDNPPYPPQHPYTSSPPYPSQPSCTTSPPSSCIRPYNSKRAIDNFECINVLGEGAFAKVYHGRNIHTQEEVAIKIVRKSRILDQYIRNRIFAEKTILKELHHPGIVRLMRTFQDDVALYFILQFAGWHNLNEQMKRYGDNLSFDLARFYVAETVSVIRYLKRHCVAHRDIKPENLLVSDEGHLILIDFNSATYFSSSTTNGTSKHISNTPSTAPNNYGGLVGTALYAPPESLKEGQYQEHPADLWALGCLAFELFAGYPPFYDTTESKILRRINNLEYTFPENFPEVAKDLVCRLLVIEPELRLGHQDADELIYHPFLIDIDVDDIYNCSPPAALCRLSVSASNDSDTIEMMQSNDLNSLELTPNIGESFLPVDTVMSKGA